LETFFWVNVLGLKPARFGPYIDLEHAVRIMVDGLPLLSDVMHLNETEVYITEEHLDGQAWIVISEKLRK
jgi:hypothetical protein